MRILLFEIGGPRQEFNEPLGIEIIGAYLKSQFAKEQIPIQVDIKWFFETEMLPDKNEMQGYDVLGFSLQIGSYKRFRKVYDIYCTISSPPVLIIGNVIPTFANKETLSHFDKAILIRGDGEIAFYKICRELATSRHLSDNVLKSITNISFIGKKQKILTSPTTPLNVKELPHATRHFLKFIKQKGGIARVEGSRGCHWGKCKFCCVKEKYGSAEWRPFPLEHIVSELEILGRSNILSPYFTDEDFFGSDYNRGKELANLIIEAKNCGRLPLQMNFFLSVMANDVKNAKGFEALTFLQKAGLREVFIGIEAFSGEQLKRFGKKANIDTNEIALNKIHEIGFQIDIGYIMFDPFMTFKELQDNIEYIEKLTLNTFDSRSLKALRIQPKTPIENEYSSVITGALDFDNLMYPYRFKDNKVQLAQDIYKQWEIPFEDATYLLQAASRGEVKDEDSRLQQKQQLGKIRNIDFKALKVIVSEISQNSGKKHIMKKLEILDPLKREKLTEQNTGADLGLLSGSRKFPALT